VLVGEERKTPVLEGFISKRNRPFKASLVLKDTGKIGWEFPPREKGGAAGITAREFEVNETPLGNCNCSSKGLVRETSTQFECEDDDCKRRVPREICKREITREEALPLFTKGETEVLENFTSKAGKPFAAQLYFKKSGKHGFRFPER
jgi:DNA topoisomerase-3